MTNPSVPVHLAERFRRHDPQLVRQLAEYLEKRLPRALAHRFGAVSGSVDLEGAGRSANRTFWRRLQDHDDPKLERMESLEDLLMWLFRVALHRGLAQLRHDDVEVKHRVALGAANQSEEVEQDKPEWLATLLERTSTASVTELVGRLFDVLDERERLIVIGRFLTDPPMAPEELAKELKISTRQVREIFAKKILVKCRALEKNPI